MKKNVLVGKLLFTAVCVIYTVGLSRAQDSLVYSWDFENEELGAYVKEEIEKDFNVYSIYHDDRSFIVQDTINGEVTKAWKMINPSNLVASGYQMYVQFDVHKELYMSYNIKFAEEWNSTSGGKLPGLRGLPTGGYDNCPDGPEDGFYLAPMFKHGNSMISYHYDRTPPVNRIGCNGWPNSTACPWAIQEYYYNPIYFSNGTWYNVTQRLVVNTFTDGVPNTDGINEIWVDGKIIFRESELILIGDPEKGIDGLFLGTYYGGKEDYYKPLYESACYIDNVILYTPTTDDVTGNQLHPVSHVLETPNEITDRELYYDKKITSPGTLQNASYPNTYGSCIDETYLIDAGDDNTVTFTWGHTIGGGEFLFFYDGNQTDSELIRIVKGYSSQSNQQITSTGRYLFIRFSTDTDMGTTGWSGNIIFNYDTTHVEEPNTPPVIEDQDFVINEQTFADNYIGRIIADDVDEGQKVTFSILLGNESGLFSLASATGDLSITQQNVFDLAVLEYNLLVQAKDNGEVVESSTANVNVTFVPETPEPDPEPDPIPTVYIDPGNANDNLEDGSLEHPFNSWSDVSWEEGYQYLQKRGTTSEETKISIYAGNVTLGAYGEGDKPVIQSTSEESAIKFFNKIDISIKDLRIIAEKAISCIYIYGEESDRNRVGNCTLEGAENGIRAIDGKSVTICYNTIKSCTDAIYSYAEDNTIYYNVFKFNIKAINITSSLSGSKIYNNVFYENGTGVSNSYSDLTLHNNIFYMVSAGDVALNQEMDELLSDNNIFYPEREGFIAIGDYSYSSLAEFQENKGIDLNSFCRDPLFVDVYNDNFDLEYTSPAIDAGTMVGLEFDFLGNHVPLGGAPDIGIIEKLVNGTTVDRSSLSDDEENKFSVFPNPTSGEVSVLCKDAPGQPADLYIKDITGKTVYMEKCFPQSNNFSQTIDVSYLPNGLYVLVVQFADKLYSQRILRTH